MTTEPQPVWSCLSTSEVTMTERGHLIVETFDRDAIASLNAMDRQTERDRDEVNAQASLTQQVVLPVEHTQSSFYKSYQHWAPPATAT